MSATTEAKALEIVDAVLEALNDHSGFDEWWTSISPPTQDDIRNSVAAKVAAILREEAP